MALTNIKPIKIEDGASRISSSFEKIKAAWNPDIKAADNADVQKIDIYESIGEDFWTGGGMTAKRVGGMLRAIGSKDLQVNINSYGGDVFEGIAIYNLLASHQAKVTVNVVGIAASAASIIAMAGDEVLMGEGAMIMVHNAWTMGVGNKADFSQLTEQLTSIDASLVDIYAARTGMKNNAIQDLMDAETFMTAEQAINEGFADGMMNVPVVDAPKNHSDNKIINAIKETTGASNAQARELKAKLKELGIVGDAEKNIVGDVQNEIDAGEIQALILKMKMA